MLIKWGKKVINQLDVSPIIALFSTRVEKKKLFPKVLTTLWLFKDNHCDCLLTENQAIAVHYHSLILHRQGAFASGFSKIECLSGSTHKHKYVYGTEA